MRKNIPWMAAAERLSAFPIVLIDEPRDQAVVVHQIFRFAESLEDSRELALVRAAQQHLVLNAAQERFIAQLFRILIGRKDQKTFEGPRDLATAHEFQITPPPFHGNNPAVQYLSGSALLAAKVVDQINPVVGF